MKEGFFFLSSAKQARRIGIGEIDVPAYYEHNMTTEEANNLPWVEFKRRINPFLNIKVNPTGLECIFTPKSPPWTNKDLNIYLGASDRRVGTIEDLGQLEGEYFFYINFLIAAKVLDYQDRESHFAIGFNPGDLLPKHHSINTRLHSHLYIADNSELRAIRRKSSWNSLSWFDRLSFMEPFIPLFKDFLDYSISNGMFSNYLSKRRIDTNAGYVSAFFQQSESLYKIFPDVQKMYLGLKTEYEKIESIFTNKMVDTQTDRYILKSLSERMNGLAEYFDCNSNWLSPESEEILNYLAKNVRPARERLPTKKSILSADNAWITKGFAGAINFAFFKDKKQVRFDFIPSIITTSTMNKVLLAEGLPTIVNRGGLFASEVQQMTMQSYYKRVSQIIASNILSM